MQKSNDPRRTWNRFIRSLSMTIKLWNEHQKAMLENRNLSELNVHDDQILSKDFWRSSFDKMIHRLLGFYYGWDFNDLLVEEPEEVKETKDDKKGGKK